MGQLLDHTSDDGTTLLLLLLQERPAKNCKTADEMGVGRTDNDDDEDRQAAAARLPALTGPAAARFGLPAQLLLQFVLEFSHAIFLHTAVI